MVKYFHTGLICDVAILSKDVNESRNARVSKKKSRAREFNFSTSEKFTYAQGEIA